MRLIWIWLIGVLVTPCFGAYLASAKNRSVVGWGLLTLVFQLIALVTLAGLPPLTSEDRRKLAADRLETYKSGWMSAEDLRQAIAEEMRSQSGSEPGPL